MDVTVLGASGTYPAPGAPASGYLIETPGTKLWCDAGPGTFQALAAVTDPATVSAVVISHMHPDHCTDLFALYHYLAFGPPAGERSVDVHAPAGAAERFAAFLEPSAENRLFRLLSFHPIEAGSRVEIGDISVLFQPAHHSVAAFLMRFSAAGREIVYTGDTGPTPVLVELARGADLLIAEASLGPDDEAFVHHMTAEQAGSAAAAAGVARLMLTHLRPTLDPALAAGAAASTFGREPIVAVPGLKISV